MALCTYNIANNIENSCDIHGGLREIGYIANRSDITGWTESGNKVSELTFDTGKKMYKIYTPAKNPFQNTATELSEGEVINRWNHTIEFIILDNSPEVAEIVNNLANGKFVIVTEAEYEGIQGVSTYQIYGLDRALKASSITHNPYENESGWVVSMVEENASYSAKFFFSTTLAATRTLLEGYCNPSED